MIMSDHPRFDRAYATGAVAQFKACLVENMRRLAAEKSEVEFAVPVALVMVIDKAHGGDETAETLIRRFALLDSESRQGIDFFFLGWRQDATGTLNFELAAFTEFRESLRKVGVTRFGGNADLFLLDAWWRNKRVELDFGKAIYIDLAAAKAKQTIVSAGAFLQDLIGAADAVQLALGVKSPVFSISDRLGLAYAKESLLDFILTKWGEIIGAKKIADLAVQRIGPTVDLAKI